MDEATPRHCDACNQMSLGEWRHVIKTGLEFHRCPICKNLCDQRFYPDTAMRAATLLKRQRPSQPQAIDTINRFAVAAGSRGTVIVMPPLGVPLTQAEALNLAAYLVAVSGSSIEDFRAVFQAVVSA